MIKTNDWVVFKTREGIRSGIVESVNSKENKAIVKVNGVHNPKKMSLSRLHLFGDNYYA